MQILARPVSLAKSMSWSFSERPCFRKQGGERLRWRVIKEGTRRPPDPTSACAPHCPDSNVSHTNFSTDAQTEMWISSSSTSLCSEAQSSHRRSPKFSFEAESFPLPSGHLSSMSDLFACSSVDLGPLGFYSPFNFHPSVSFSPLPWCLTQSLC